MRFFVGFFRVHWGASLGISLTSDPYDNPDDAEGDEAEENENEEQEAEDHAAGEVEGEDAVMGGGAGEAEGEGEGIGQVGVEEQEPVPTSEKSSLPHAADPTEDRDQMVYIID